MLLWEMYDIFQPFYEIDPDKNSNEIDSKIEKGVDFEFEENINDSLAELIKKGYNKDPEKRPSFNEILNTMISETIMFPDSDREEIEKFYNSKRSINQNPYQD